MTTRGSARLLDENDPDGLVEVTGGHGFRAVMPRADYLALREDGRAPPSRPAPDPANYPAACLARRAIPLSGTPEDLARITWLNSHRFRQYGMGDGRVWRLARRCEP